METSITIGLLLRRGWGSGSCIDYILINITNLHPRFSHTSKKKKKKVECFLALLTNYKVNTFPTQPKSLGVGDTYCTGG